MFTKSNLTKMLFFDIETCGKYESYEEFLKADPVGASIFAGKCKRLNFGEPSEGYLDKVALFPEFGKIVCLSYGIWVDGVITVKTIDDEDESVLLKKTANLFNKAATKNLAPTGWNIKNFDIPWVVRKMLMHGIPVPSLIETHGKKPWEVSIIDLKEWWKSFSTLDVTFEEAAYSMSIPSPKDEMHGGQVHENYWFKANKDGIVTYCEKDVKTMIIMIEKISTIYDIAPF
jgi:predicted PolB exonuclease-like 3'-5' exonuclease